MEMETDGKYLGSDFLGKFWGELDSYPNNDDYDPYDDDMYENHDLSENLQSICDDLDITVHVLDGIRKLFKTRGLDESSSPEFDLFSDLEENSEEEVVETMAETMEQYMSKTRANYGSGVTGPKINDKDHFELKGQFLKELRDKTFSGLDHEDATEHIKKVLEIVDLFHIPNITQDQIMLRAFPMSLTGATSCWLRNKPSGLITNWEDLHAKFLNRTVKHPKGIAKNVLVGIFVENMDPYHDEGIRDVIVREPFCKASCVEAKRFDGIITIRDGDDSVTYKIVRENSRFKHLTHEKCKKIPSLLKVSEQDKMNGILHLYQKLKGFYKGVLNLGPEFIQDAKIEE
uniref:Retrotransposon gag domain-containing protein n=1 Tax=Tanacetum cinerariifolium TaxID=118510 RepID=A0A6L2JB44_TANCI|nr:hypothetical protein [Tanacetum cinerariifolium]